MEKSKELKTAISAAEEAGKILLERLGKAKEVEGKGHFLTEADLESEKAIIAAVEKGFPGYNIVSEEAGEKAKGSDRTWIVDPLDGSRNYFRNFPVFTVSIALASREDLILGVVFDPSAKRLYYAEKGKGAFLNGERIAVSREKDLGKAVVSFDYGGLEKAALEELGKIAGKTFRVRNLGNGSLGLCYLAQGGYDAYACAYQTKLVDIAAGIAIAREAGATVTDKKGGKPNLFESREIVASNGLLHKELLKVFG